MHNSLRKYIPFRLAFLTVVILNSLVICFHFLVLLRIVPFENVWGGKLKTSNEMYVFESISIAINGLLIGLVLLKTKLLPFRLPLPLVNGLLWVFAVIFVINTLGNLAAETTLETLIATPLTFILSILCWRLALHENQVSVAQEGV